MAVAVVHIAQTREVREEMGIHQQHLHPKDYKAVLAVVMVGQPIPAQSQEEVVVELLVKGRRVALELEAQGVVERRTRLRDRQ